MIHLKPKDNRKKSKEKICHWHINVLKCATQSRMQHRTGHLVSSFKKQ